MVNYNLVLNILNIYQTFYTLDERRARPHSQGVKIDDELISSRASSSYAFLSLPENK